MTQLLEGFEYTPKLQKWEKLTVGNARAVCFIDGKLLLIKRVREGQTFYVLPGGRVDEGENAREAVVRELREEANVDVVVTRELYRVAARPGKFYFANLGIFLCEYKMGEISKTDSPDEYAAGVENETHYDGRPKGTFEPVLLSVAQLKDVNIYPDNAVAQLLVDIEKYGIHLTRPTKFIK